MFDLLADLTPSLKEMIELKYGFIDQLISAGLLKSNEAPKNKKLETQMQKLLEILTVKSKENSENFDIHFLQALKDTDQEHVANWITSEKHHKPEFADCWPLDEDRKSRIDEKWSDLCEFLDTNDQFCDYLRSTRCLTSRQMDRVEECEWSIRNREVLEMLKRRSNAHFQEFINCLLKTNQPHVVPLLTGQNAEDLTSEQLILSHKVRERITDKWRELKEEIIFSPELCGFLISEKCITVKQKEDIDTKGLTRLLQIMRRTSVATFEKFVVCFVRAHQEHVASLLRTDKVDEATGATNGQPEPAQQIAKNARTLPSERVVPQFLASLESPTGSISSVTQANNRIYAVFLSTRWIGVFNDQPPFTPITSFEVNSTVMPRHIEASNDRLFVSQFVMGNIWRVNLQTHESDNFIVHQYPVQSLSVNSGRLLVTFINRSELCIYDVDDGKLLDKIIIFTCPKDAIEVDAEKSKRFFVCYLPPTEDKNYVVSDIYQPDRILNVYNGSIFSEHFRYMALHPGGRLLVIHDDKILLLNEQLRDERVLIDYNERNEHSKNKRWPLKLHYFEYRKLIVVILTGGLVEIFEWS